MSTYEKFREDFYLKECSAAVVAVTEYKGHTLIEVDETIFFPEGGGQSGDKGFINNIEIINTYALNGIIYHETQDTSALAVIKTGDIVNLKLDWKHRFDNMQRHCGEHILTGIIDREYGGVNRGFHMGDEYMTIDISMEKDSNYSEFTWEMALNAEIKANELICENVPMIFHHFDTYDEAVKLPMRKDLTIKENITTVGIGSDDNAWGCVACCGTHPSHTGDVGLIKIYKVEPNKGMFRIYFEAGKRAFIKYQEQYNVLSEMNNKLSANTTDLVSKYKTAQDKNNETRVHLHNIKKFALDLECDKLLNTEYSNYSSLIRKDYDTLEIDDILALAKLLSDKCNKLYMLVHSKSNTTILTSNGSNYNCGKLVKENIGIYNGKGGGAPTSARAIFNRLDDLNMFIELINLQIEHNS